MLDNIYIWVNFDNEIELVAMRKYLNKDNRYNYRKSVYSCKTLEEAIFKSRSLRLF